MVSRKCLATLRRPSTAPTLSAIAASPRSGLRARVVAAWILARFFFGGGEQVLALARPLGGQIGVPADDQPLARENRAS